MLLKADFKRECTKEKKKKTTGVFSDMEVHIYIYQNILALKTESEISIPHTLKFETQTWMNFK